MKDIVHSLGGSKIKADYAGHSKNTHGVLALTGKIDFTLTDAFRDPLNIGTYLKEPYALIDEIIVDAIKRDFKRVEEVVSYVIDKLSSIIGKVSQDLYDYIYDRALRILQRQHKNAALNIGRKDLREILFSTIYAITDKWSATFSAKVYLDAAKSQFKRRCVKINK